MNDLFNTLGNILRPASIVQVCKTDCDKKPFKTKVGKVTHTFCCKKGFEISLKEFANSIKK